MDLVEIKTSELIGPALDWVVAKVAGVISEGQQLEYTIPGDARPGDVIKIDKIMIAEPGRLEYRFSPSTDWSQGGPLIEREISKLFKNVGGRYTAQVRHEGDHPLVSHKVLEGWTNAAGPTPLIAAMRCLVASKLGDTVQVPKELLV